MYIGRFLVVSPTVAAYRVSSRSFPHRQVVRRDDALAVVPTPDAPATDNPYVSYHCLRVDGTAATLGNGSHVDPIAEKHALGYPARDAMVTGLFALDYEKDDYDTPRIAAVLEPDRATVGVVRRDGITVRTVEEPTILSTYERDEPEPFDVSWEDADAAAQGVYELSFEHPVCAAAVARTADGFETAIWNGPGDQ